MPHGTAACSHPNSQASIGRLPLPLSPCAADPLPPPPSLRSAAISSMFMTPALAPVVRRSFGRLLAANVNMSIAFASVIYRFRRPPFLSLSLLVLARPHLDVSITRFRRSHSTPVPALVLHLCNAHRIALSRSRNKTSPISFASRPPSSGVSSVARRRAAACSNSLVACV